MPATPDADNFLDFLRLELIGYFTLRPVLVLLAAFAGTLAIYPTLGYLWALWLYDPLKSLGMFIPLVSVALLLRAWRNIGWEMHGTWWGLAVIALTVGAVHLRSQALLLLVLSASWSLYIPPHGIVIFAYASGVVLLFGGTRLYRAALFPILLLLCVDPVPHIFNVFVDLPLQRISAHVARGFAHVLGFPLTSDQLRLMFTPDFGMFIAPGCNGIRGATTMGYIALIAGYLYRFRLRAWVLLVAGAILLGYVFNFLRLCVLVLYYLVALKIVWLQDKATNGDYVIGACLFTIAATLLVLAIRKAGRKRSVVEPEPKDNSEALAVEAAHDTRSLRSYYPRLTAFLVLVAIGSVAYAVPWATSMSRVMTGAAKQQTAFIGHFPQQMGAYTLSRTWKEQLSTGVIVYEWAEYVRNDNGLRIQLGISPGMGAHDTTLCHVARGEDAIWQSTVVFPSADHTDESFSASMYNDGVSQFVEASTLCTLAGCGEYTSVHSHFGIIFSLPHAGTILQQPDEAKPLPILLRAETIDVAQPKDAARALLLNELRGFVREISLTQLTAEYRGPVAAPGIPQQ